VFITFKKDISILRLISYEWHKFFFCFFELKKVSLPKERNEIRMASSSCDNFNSKNEVV
jgi:hypothetical protein